MRIACGIERMAYRKRLSAIRYALCAVFLAGCVERTIVIESDPPGATVWVNEHPVGPTPLTYEFITHGRYTFRILKTGFRELVTRERVMAPIYQWIPLDLVSEYLVPFQFKDRHLFRYKLVPQPPEERLETVRLTDVQKVVGELKNPDPKKRRSACITLASLRDPATEEAVRAATQDPSPIVRAAALEAWRAIAGSKSLEELLQALRRDSDPQVRWQAAVELEALKDARAIPGLIEALKDRDPLVRTGAAEALKGIPNPMALQPLVQALRDRDTAVRRAATEGLGKIGDKAAVAPLSKVLFHHDVHTRRKAVEGLARLKDPASGPALVRTFTDWDPKVRQVATKALIAFGDERVVPILVRRLRGLKPWTREHAAQVLGGLKDPRAVEPLAKAFRRESNFPASQAMVQALTALGVKPDETWDQTLSIRMKRAEEKAEEEKKKKRP